MEVRKEQFPKEARSTKQDGKQEVVNALEQQVLQCRSIVIRHREVLRGVL